MAYRSKDSHFGKTPEARAAQLANLEKRHKTKPISSEYSKSVRVNIKDDIIVFAEGHFVIPETRKPIVLLDWEKDIFRDIFEADVKPSLALLGMPKKSGKSTLAAIVALWVLITKPMAEIYLMGPDIQQSQLVVFDKICKAIRMHPILRDFCKVKHDRIDCKKTSSFLQVLPCNKTSAGLNPDVVIFDELWQFTTTEAKRAIDEMTTVPTKEMLTLIVTYAGYQEDVDTPLYELYQQGIAQREGKEEKDEKYYFLWRTDYEGVPWVTEKYLATQKKRLRENTYRRLHKNEWVSSEEAFVNVDILDLCTNADLVRGGVTEKDVCVGIDIGLKHDCSAVAVVGAVDSDTLALYDHCLWVPKRNQTLNLEETVEAMLVIFSKTYRIRACYYDPYQFERSAQTLRNRGLPMREWPQTVANTCAMSQTLQNLLTSANLMLYSDKEIRQHLLNAKVKETPRGWRLIKGTQAQKIDLAIALAEACQAAQDCMMLQVKAGIIFSPSWDDEGYGNAYEAEWGNDESVWTIQGQR